MSANWHVFVVFGGPYTGPQKAAQHMLFQGLPFLGVCAFRHTRLQLELGGMEIGSDGFIRPMRGIDLLPGVAVLWGTLGQFPFIRSRSVSQHIWAHQRGLCHASVLCTKQC